MTGKATIRSAYELLLQLLKTPPQPRAGRPAVPALQTRKKPSPTQVFRVERREARAFCLDVRGVVRIPDRAGACPSRQRQEDRRALPRLTDGECSP